MADEQPALMNREVRDVKNVPRAEELVKNNVGSTVRDNSRFNVVTQVGRGMHDTYHEYDIVYVFTSYLLVWRYCHFVRERVDGEGFA